MAGLNYQEEISGEVPLVVMMPASVESTDDDLSQRASDRVGRRSPVMAVVAAAFVMGGAGLLLVSSSRAGRGFLAPPSHVEGATDDSIDLMGRVAWDTRAIKYDWVAFGNGKKDGGAEVLEKGDTINSGYSWSSMTMGLHSCKAVCESIPKCLSFVVCGGSQSGKCFPKTKLLHGQEPSFANTYCTSYYSPQIEQKIADGKGKISFGEKAIIHVKEANEARKKRWAAEGQDMTPIVPGSLDWKSAERTGIPR